MARRRFLLSSLFIVATAAILAMAATLLPDNSYQRFQLLDDTIYSQARWFYERMHNDPRPIDVVILGDSRTLNGLRPKRIQAQLEAAGTPGQVVNMSLVGGGRNVQWLIVRDLLGTKRPKVLVIAVRQQPYPWGHDTFRYLAPAKDIWFEASQGLYHARRNLLYLPYRQITLAWALIAPSAAGLTKQFDPRRYEEAEVDLDAKRRTQDGLWIDPYLRVPRSTLLQQLREHAHEDHLKSHLPGAIRAVTDQDDRVYTDLIARAAAEHGVKLVFVCMPAFHRAAPIVNRPYYATLGRVQENQDLVERDELYMDWNHLNAEGAAIVSDRVAAVVARAMREAAELKAQRQPQKASKQS